MSSRLEKKINGAHYCLTKLLINGVFVMTTQSIIADIGLADWGRKEIKIAETEMPGLMAIR